MPASNIDFACLSHVIHFSLIPQADGSLNASGNGVTASHATDLVSCAHAAGRKALICVGGADSEAGFQGATSSANCAIFISNLTNFMSIWGYDGIDVDWEPLLAADAGQYTNLIKGLRTALTGFPEHKLLTAAAGAYSDYRDPPATTYKLFASLQTNFDQINIMTYDLSGPYGGWVTWYNSPVFDGGYRFPSTGGPVPSINGAVDNFIANGVLPGKLGIGIPFYGYVWTGGSGTTPSGGVTVPRQSWTTNAPTVSALAFSTILGSYFQLNNYHWDTNAQAAYLSLTTSASPAFISYDDQHTCQVKVSYARNHRLGGLMIWELSQDYFPTLPPGQRAPLLRAIKDSLATPGLMKTEWNGPALELRFNTLPLSLYRVEWTTNLTGPWNTLSNNVAGTGEIIRVNDPDALTHPQRFYRVQTPP